MAGIEWSIAQRVITGSTWMFLELHAVPLPVALAFVVIGLLLTGLAIMVRTPRPAAFVAGSALRIRPVVLRARGIVIGVGLHPVGGRGARAPAGSRSGAPAI